MKTCAKCNTSNQDGFAFCEKCGARLEEEQSIPTSDNNNSSSPQPKSQPISQPVYQPVHTATDPTPGGKIPNNAAPVSPAPKKSSPVFKIILVLVAAAVLYFVVSSLLFSNPTYKLLKGLAGLSKMDKVTSVTTVNIEYKGDTEEAEILNDVTIKANVAADIKNLLAESSLELLYDNKSVTKVAVGVNNEEIYVDPLNLYKEKFYQELESIIPEYTENIEAVKVIIKALEGVKLKADQKKYADIIKEVLDDDIKGSGNKVIITMSADTSIELMEAVLEEAADDEKLMESVRTSAIDVIKKLLKEKKKLEDLIEEDDLEEALESLEDKDEFEDMYKEAMDEALSSLKYTIESNSYTDAVPEMEVTFVFGMFNKIKSINYKMEVEDPYSGDNYTFDVESEVKNGAKFTKINKKSAVEIQELMTDPDEMQEVAEDVVANLIKAIKTNKKLTEQIEDVSGQDIEDLEEYILQSVLYMGY